uniref:Ulp1 protease-like n=1 Tax=Oryza glaberrima TaxID=4538 RepID=I1R412_ORYGL
MTRQSTPNTIDIKATTYKPTYSKTRRRISTSGIGMAIPLRFEEEGYPVVDYESDLQTDMSTTVR